MNADKPLALVFRFLQAGMGGLRLYARKPVPARSAAINRWTGKPHNHARAKARQLARIAKLKARTRTGSETA
jgi:hypothetical protein